MLIPPEGQRPQHKDCGHEGKVQETPSEEGSHVCRRHAESPAGLQAHSQHGPEGQPEAGQEGGQGGGELLPVYRSFKFVIPVELHIKIVLCYIVNITCLCLN